MHEVAGGKSLAGMSCRGEFSGRPLARWGRRVLAAVKRNDFSADENVLERCRCLRHRMLGVYAVQHEHPQNRD